MTLSFFTSILCILCCLAAYFICSINAAIVLTRMLGLPEIRDFGSGNPGATNMTRVYGKKLGITTFIFDFFKGFCIIIMIKLLLPTLLQAYCSLASAFTPTQSNILERFAQLNRLLPDQSDAIKLLQSPHLITETTNMICILTCISCILGHIFPLFYRFRGGKGVATGFGVIAAINPLLFMMIVMMWASYFLIKKNAGIASVFSFAVVLCYGLVMFRHSGMYKDLCYCAIACIIIAKHASNIRATFLRA